ncbi:hypothetical protein QNA23_05830 [Rhodococcus erythropolis]|uniref:hypothetical protein n=1 Tax=Rhodococcus TaxID=1827 RepID=UPI001144399B|nr:MULTISPECIES: hypothetical protein [Rhodococcus]MDJ0402986.1 hypothetical protein [Rhodococcus erythropolis]TQC39800.1 hypothetical protein EEB16_08535 [Rhodococcus sp. WS7]
MSKPLSPTATKGRDVRPAIFGAIGLLTGIIAAIPSRGAHEAPLDFAARWYCLPLAMVVIASIVVGQLRDRSERYVMAAGTLFILSGFAQFRYFLIVLMYRDLYSMVGMISAGCLFAAGVMALQRQTSQPDQ